jgi:hypothetical protein
MSGWPELDFGQWEGRHWQEIDRVALDDWAASPERFAPPGGESGQALRHRVRAFWRDVCHAGKAACVVSHGGPLRVLTALAEGRGPDLLRPFHAAGLRPVVGDLAGCFVAGTGGCFWPKRTRDRLRALAFNPAAAGGVAAFPSAAFQFGG